MPPFQIGARGRVFTVAIIGGPGCARFVAIAEGREPIELLSRATEAELGLALFYENGVAVPEGSDAEQVMLALVSQGRARRL
jgi:hypothetical protein